MFRHSRVHTFGSYVGLHTNVNIKIKSSSEMPICQFRRPLYMELRSTTDVTGRDRNAHP